MSMQHRLAGLRRYLALLALVLTAPVLVGAAGHFSASERSALLDIARSNPGAASALVFIDLESPSGSSGILYFEARPSIDALAVLLGAGDERMLISAGALIPVFPQYTEANSLVEVRWTLSRVNESTVLIATRTQLVNHEGEALDPAHLLEAPVTIVAVGGTLSIGGRVASSAI